MNHPTINGGGNWTASGLFGSSGTNCSNALSPNYTETANVPRKYRANGGIETKSVLKRQKWFEPETTTPSDANASDGSASAIANMAPALAEVAE